MFKYATEKCFYQMMLKIFSESLSKDQFTSTLVMWTYLLKKKLKIKGYS